MLLCYCRREVAIMVAERGPVAASSRGGPVATGNTAPHSLPVRRSRFCRPRQSEAVGTCGAPSWQYGWQPAARS
jgi:hypothetical protein